MAPEAIVVKRETLFDTGVLVNHPTVIPNLTMDITFFKAPIRSGSSYPRLPKCQKKPNYNNNNKNSTSSRPQSPNYNRDGNRSRQPFSLNRHRNVQNHINSLFDQEQTDHTMSHKENTETQNVSEEQLLEQQLNHLLLELNQDPNDEYFNCQDESNNLTKNLFFLHHVSI